MKKGDRGPEVAELQRLLVQRGYTVSVDGDYGTRTYQAVRAFQSQNLDQHGAPLVVDGKVGPLTWWSLHNPKPDFTPPSAVDYGRLPPPDAGGSARGRAALEVAVGELNAGAAEIGGNNASESTSGPPASPKATPGVPRSSAGAISKPPVESRG
jgi:hypothetical protein